MIEIREKASVLDALYMSKLEVELGHETLLSNLALRVPVGMVSQGRHQQQMVGESYHVGPLHEMYFKLCLVYVEHAFRFITGETTSGILPFHRFERFMFRLMPLDSLKITLHMPVDTKCTIARLACICHRCLVFAQRPVVQVSENNFRHRFWWLAEENMLGKKFRIVVPHTSAVIKHATPQVTQFVFGSC